MKCLSCNLETKVIESRPSGQHNVVRRRRQCEACQTRFTTYERMELPSLVVIKNDKSTEYFRFDKLLAGLMRATKKTTMTPKQTEDLARKIERQILASGKTEIKSQKIGNVVIEHLAEVNKVAYMRFVSVYRRLKTIDSFERELNIIKNA